MAEETLLTMVESLAEATRQVGRTRAVCLRQAGEHVLRRDAPATLALPWIRDVRLDWVYQIARSQDRVVLFFFRSAPRTTMAVTARLGFTLRPVPAPVAGTHPRLIALEARVQRPGFLLPPREGWMRFALDPPFGGVLNVRYDGGDLDDAEVVWDRSTDSFEPRLDEPAEGKASARRTWSMAPFLGWLETVRAWLADPATGGTWAPCDIPDPTQPGLNVTQLTLGLIGRAYRRVTESAEADATFGAMRWTQAVDTFSGTSTLRLTRDGLDLAAPDEPNPLVLDMDYRAVREGDRARLEVALRPPDFAHQGPYRDALIDAFLEGAIEAGCRGIVPTPDGRIVVDRSNLAELFASGRARAFTLRTHRKEREVDVNLLVLPGRLEGVEIVAMFRASFRTRRTDPSDTGKAGRPGTRRSRDGSLDEKPVLDGEVRMLRPHLDGNPNDAREDLVKSLLQLMRALASWGGLLR